MALNDGNPIKRSAQHIANAGYDEFAQLPISELGGTDGTTHVSSDGNTYQNQYKVGVTSGGNLMTQAFSALVPGSYDYIGFSPSTAQPTTITFRSGGATGTIVSTLTLSYSGTDITAITKS